MTKEITFKRKTRVWGPYQDWWTTIGSTIYYPSNAQYKDWGFGQDADVTILHEKVHVEQWQKYGWLFPILYFLFPLPIGLAYFRWKFEREAYLVELKNGWTVDQCVDVIWRDYLFPWPKSWMKRWFYAEMLKT